MMAEIKLVRSDEPQRNKTDYYRHGAQRYSGDRGSTVVGFTAFDTGPRGQASRQRGSAEEEANGKPAGSDGDPPRISETTPSLLRCGPATARYPTPGGDGTAGRSSDWLWWATLTRLRLAERLYLATAVSTLPLTKSGQLRVAAGRTIDASGVSI